MSKFEVGDVLRVRSWEDMEQKFGLNNSTSISCEFYFTSGMKYMCGKEFVVREIVNDEYYSESRIEGGYHISSDMLEPASEQEPIDLDAFCKILDA